MQALSDVLTRNGVPLRVLLTSADAPRTVSPNTWPFGYVQVIQKSFAVVCIVSERFQADSICHAHVQDAVASGRPLAIVWLQVFNLNFEVWN